MTHTLSCEAADSHAVLEAARAAMPTSYSPWAPELQWINQLPEKQRPLVPLLMALLDSTQAVARAIADNACDDSQPLDRLMAEDLAQQARSIANDINVSWQCADAASWSLPSMTGKELV